MDRFVQRCAGLDVHKDTVAATVRVLACTASGACGDVVIGRRRT